VIVHAHGWLSGAYVFAGRADDAVRQGEYARQLAESKGDELARASALVQAGFVRFYRGEQQECRAFAEAGSLIAAERRFPFHVACTRILLGWCLSHEGRHDEALHEIRAGLKTCNAIGARLETPLFLTMLGECLERAGERAEALQTIDEAMALVNRNRSFFYLPEIYRVLGDLHLRRGDRETATVAFKRALLLAVEQQSPLLISRAERSLGDLAQAQ
jgi:tetratricopeptide (TPR) repeat protein